MKPFNSFLTPELEGFVAWRDNLGLNNRNLRSSLRCFDRYVLDKKNGWDDFTPGFFLEFQRNAFGQNRTVNIKMSIISGFFNYLVRKDVLDSNPLEDIPSRYENRFVPFIFSAKQVDQLLLGAQQRIRKDKKYFFRDYTIATAFTVLARCGLRITEPLRLLMDSFRLDEGTIYIRKTKFYKDRLIPLPLTTAQELENYLVVRKSFLDHENPFLFPGFIKGRGLTPGSIYSLFHPLLTDMGISRKKRIIGTTTFGAPTVHSMRHSFAVNTLKRAKNPQNALPVLAAYMGHRKYSYTSLYLKMLDAEQRNNLVDFTLSHWNKL